MIDVKPQKWIIYSNQIAFRKNLSELNISLSIRQKL